MTEIARRERTEANLRQYEAVQYITAQCRSHTARRRCTMNHKDERFILMAPIKNTGTWCETAQRADVCLDVSVSERLYNKAVISPSDNKGVMDGLDLTT